MVANKLVDREEPRFGRSLFTRFSDLSLATHRHLLELMAGTGAKAGRNLADAIHMLCALYGRRPGVLDHANLNCNSDGEQEWLRQASHSFEQERAYLIGLSAACGAIPSTPGAAQSEAAVSAQRHALDTLARSERRGCSLGAAVTLVHQWEFIRHLLDKAAARNSAPIPACTLPNSESISEVIEIVGDTPVRQRAIGFGSEQILLQHRALFDLLETRAGARSDF